MATGINFQTVSFCLSGIMTSLCSSTKAVPRSTSMSKSSTTVNSAFVTRSLIGTCSVVLLLVLSWVFHADKSNACTFLDTLGSQSVGRNAFETRFAWAPISRSSLHGA